MNLNELITLSPEHDSFLLQGRETYLQDVPRELERLADVGMPEDFKQDLLNALEFGMASGYVEITVTWSPEKGWNF